MHSVCETIMFCLLNTYFVYQKSYFVCEEIEKGIFVYMKRHILNIKKHFCMKKKKCILKEYCTSILRDEFNISSDIFD
jgi:hypothetical protein